MPNESILIVEDQETISTYIESLLSELGYNKLRKVPSGEEALLLVEKEKPDLILMDVELSGEIDGIETTNQIIQSYGDEIAIIYLTKKNDSLTLDKMLPTQPKSYIPKPIDPLNLHMAIKIALQKNKKYPGQESDEKLLANSFFVWDGKGIEIKIDTKNVYWIKAEGAYCEIVMEDRTRTPSFNLHNFNHKVNQTNLVRIHRKYIVNVDKIVGFEGSKVIVEVPNHLKTQEKELRLPIGKKYFGNFIKRFNRLRGK